MTQIGTGDQRDQCLFRSEWRLMWSGLLKWNNQSEVVCFFAKQANIPLTDKILHQLICKTSHDLLGFSHLKWYRILSTNSMSVKLINICFTKDWIANHSGQLLNLDILGYWSSLNLNKWYFTLGAWVRSWHFINSIQVVAMLLPQQHRLQIQCMLWNYLAYLAGLSNT